MSLLDHIVESDAPKAALLVRLMVGAVFLLEGVQKFVEPALRGPGRFAKMGFPHPELLAHLVGALETVCGVLVLLGLLTRIAAIPLVVVMVVAIVTTKVPVLLGHGFGPFTVRELPVYGFLAMAHEMRTDWAMLLGALFLLWAGAGPWSLERRIARGGRPHR